MNDIRKRVSRFTLKLQSQTHLPLWAIANEKVIYSIAMGETPIWGSKSRILRGIINIAYKMHLADLVLFFVGLLCALHLWWVVSKPVFKIRRPSSFKRIFAGFGASSEEYLYADYIKQATTPSLRINWVTYAGLDKLERPRLLLILVLLIKNSFGYCTKLKSAPPEISLNVVEFLTVCALNIGTYAFFRSYWRMAKSHGINEVTFVTPDILVFACVDENIKTIYLQHGLLALSILFPRVNRIDAITFDEERYLKAALKDVHVARATKNIKSHDAKNNILLILSPNIFIKNRLAVLESLVEWAVQKKLQIIIRPTPTASQDDLIILQTKFPTFVLDDVTIPLHVRFEKLNPKFVASSTSTGLATALDYQCLPISLSDPLANDHTWSMIYSMQNRVLFWPRDQALIEAAAHSTDIYYTHLTNLCRYEDLCLNPT